MFKSKYAVLAAAAVAAAPLVGRAATITYSYDPNDFGYYAASDTGFATLIPLTTGGSAAAPTLTVPAGATVVFGVDGLVTGNANGAPQGGTSFSATKYAQPAQLGLGSFGFGFNTSSAANASFDLTNFPATIDAPYTTQTTGVTNGTGGILPPVGIFGGFNGAGSPGSLAASTSLGNAAGTATELFNSLGVKVTGNATITPVKGAGSDTYVTYVSGGTSKTNAPVYAQVTAVQGVDTINNMPALTILISGATTTNPSHPIIALTASANSSYGSLLTAPAGTATFTPGSATSTAITVTALGPGSYLPGFAHVVAAAGSTVGTVAVTGFNSTATQEIYGLHLLVGGVLPTANQIGQIIQDINAGAGGVTASTIPAAYAGIFKASAGYDLLLTSTTSIPNGDLGFDFSQETNVAGVSVADIGAVPEPASAAVVLLGAGSLMLGRRKRTA